MIKEKLISLNSQLDKDIKTYKMILSETLEYNLVPSIHIDVDHL